MTIGENVKAIRKERKLTQKQLAERMNISRSYLSDIENNRKNPSSKTLQSISEKLNVSMAYLITGEKTIDSLSNEKELHFKEAFHKQDLIEPKTINEEILHLSDRIGKKVYLEYGDYNYYEDYDDDYENYEENQHNIDKRTSPHPVDKRKENETKQRIVEESNKPPNFYIMDIDKRNNGKIVTVPHFELHALLASNIEVSFNLTPLTDKDKKNIIKFIKTHIIDKK